MRLITCHRGQLHALFSEALGQRREKIFPTGLPAIDALLPAGGLPRGAVHEILARPQDDPPLFFAMLLARAAAGEFPLSPPLFPSLPVLRGRAGVGAEHQAPAETHPDAKFSEFSAISACSAVKSDFKNPARLENPQPHRAIIWCDPARSIYAPALAAAGIDLDRLYLLRPANPRDLLWGMAESLRCPGVAAVVGAPAGLTRIDARRLQLAAETGGGAGLLLRTPRHERQNAAHYAAATRWAVQPAPGDTTVQRWKIRLIHCHGGDTEKSVLLEHSRETNSVRAIPQLADRSTQPQTAGA